MTSVLRLLFRGFTLVVAFLAAGWFATTRSKADQPVCIAIDSVVERDIDLLCGTRESDGLLLRRLSLDLRLVIPTLAELDEFLADQSTDRWVRWVERFLDDPLHRERMVDWLDKTLMNRRPHKNVDRAKWLAYLRQVVDERKPLDAILKESVTSVWWNASQRGQQRFFLDRDGDSHAVSRDIGRIFFGRDMQCAQCHDHPQVDDYLQIDYHGILGFVSPSSLAEAKYKNDKGAEQKLQVYVERAAGDATFESVFDKGVLFRSGARVPGGRELIEPYQTPDKRYQSAPFPDSLEGVPNPPIASRRETLATELASAHSSFANNWANRVWALMMGRGIVHPLDMHHADNPPTNPQLLAVLAKSLVETGYDARSLIRQIALSETYQHGSRMPIENSLRSKAVIDLPSESLQKMAYEVHSRKQAIESQIESMSSVADLAKKEMDEARTAWLAIQKERVGVRAELDKAEGKFNEVKKKLDESNVALNKATKQRDDLLLRGKLLEEATRNLEQAKALIPGEDAELSQAVATAKAKTESVKTALPASEKAITDATTARDNKNTSVESERSLVLSVADRLHPIEQPLQDKDRLFVTARAKWQRAQSEYIHATVRMAALGRVQNWIDASQRVPSEESNLAVTLQTSERIQATIASHVANQSTVEQKITEANSVRLSIEGKRNVAQKNVENLDSEISVLQATLGSLEKSAALLASAESFAAAQQSIEAGLAVRQTTHSSSRADLAKLERDLASQSQTLANFGKELAELKKHLLAAQKQLEQNKQEVVACQTRIQQAKDSCETAMQQVVEDRQREWKTSSFRSLSPEQLGLSILHATGVLNNYIAAEAAELEKQNPLAADASPELRNARALQATRQGIDKLRSNVDVFSNLYASGVGQTSDEFFATPDQALYMANGGAVFQWSAANGNNVTGQVIKEPVANVATRMMFTALLSRTPTPNEEQWICEQLTMAADKKAPIAQELVWGLLTSSEFRVYP
jgi:hypothetical protein